MVILHETDVARFFADAESTYTYEGSHEVNALIVGREITGLELPLFNVKKAIEGFSIVA